jgi:acyl carrier protein
VEVEQKLKHFIAAELMYADDDALSSDEPLLGSGIVDSLGIMRLVSYIEEEFGVVVPEEGHVPDHFESGWRQTALVEPLEWA